MRCEGSFQLKKLMLNYDDNNILYDFSSNGNMDADSKIKTGWVVLGVAFGIAMLIVAIMDPDVEREEQCEAMLAIEGSSTEACEQVLSEAELTNTLMGVFCFLPGMVGSVFLGLGYHARNKETLSISSPSPTYMMPAQPTYAAPPIQQPNTSEADYQLKQQRMKNVELLRSEGRLMEAALEAEQAGEYSFAGELRKQAEDKLRNSHQPQSNNEDQYLVFLTTALADGFLSMEEENLLETKRSELGISWDVHVNMLTTAGYSHEKLKLLQNAKSMEDSGRLLESAGLYEAAGNLDRAQMLRMKAKMIESSQSNITYNISDSAVSGNIGSNIFDDEN